MRRTHWMNDAVKNTRVRYEDVQKYIEHGYRLGRLTDTSRALIFDIEFKRGVKQEKPKPAAMK